MVSDLRNLFLRILLHADAIVKDCKNLHITHVNKLSSENLASLAQNGDVILTIDFQQ